MKSIGNLGSKYMADNLRKQVHVEGRIKSLNESVFYNIDAIQRALSMRRKIGFRYFKYDENKNRVLQRDGKFYVETPVQLVYMDDEYYVIVWNDKYSGFTNYRVDRMVEIAVSDEAATRNDSIASFDVAKYQQRVFGMFSGTSVGVTLVVRGTAMSAVVDRFGKDVKVVPAQGGWSRVFVTVMEAPTFFGWLTTLGQDVRIEQPELLKTSYLAYLDSIVSSYR